MRRLAVVAVLVGPTFTCASLLRYATSSPAAGNPVWLDAAAVAAGASVYLSRVLRSEEPARWTEDDLPD